MDFHGEGTKDGQISTLFLVFLLLSISISNSPLGQSSFVTFFGPVDFLRGTGKPVVEVKEFSAFGFLPPFTLHLRNGDENGNNRVSSAEVWLNGNPLFKESDFSQQVSGYDVAVSLNSLNSLKVKLNSIPRSKLTIWIEGNPPQLAVTLDEAHRVSAPMTSSGGNLSTTAADGTTMVLTIPEGALYEDQQISLTPIVSITGLTLSGGFLRGADLEPDGLRLLKPSTLEITPPTSLNIQNKLVGFTYSGDGENFHLFPAISNQASIIFHLFHFSGFGAGDGTDEEMGATTTATPRSDEETWAESEIAAVLAECMDAYGTGTCVLTQQQKERVMNAFIYWFEQGILPELGEAVSCAADLNCSIFQALFQHMISIMANWLGDAQQLGLSEDLLIQLMNQRFRSLVETEFEDILHDYEVICSSSTDFCGEQKELAERYLLVWTVLQMFGWHFSDVPLPEDFCPSFLEKSVYKVRIISPKPTIISVGEKKTLELEIKNLFGQLIQDVTEIEITWESSDPTKASVDKSTGIVTGVAEGFATIKVKVTQCDTEHNDEVLVEVQEGNYALTWQATIHDSQECSWTRQGMPPITTTDKEAIEAVFKGDAVVSSSGEIISLSADYFSQRDYQRSVTTPCGEGPAATWHNDFSSQNQMTKEGLEMIARILRLRFLANSVEISHLYPPQIHWHEISTEGGNTCDKNYPPITSDYEGVSPSYSPSFAGMIPAVDASGESFYLTTNLDSGFLIGGPEPMCPRRSVLATWEIRVKKI